MSVWVELTEVTGRQHGAFARAQAYGAGADRWWLRRRVGEGSVLEAGADVFVLAGSPDTLDRRRWVALLAAGPGSHLSHEAAAELLGIPGVLRGLVVVTAAHPHHVRLRGAALHQLDDVAPEHLTVVAGYPTTTPARTVVDLAAVLSWLRLERALEHVVVEHMATLSQIADVLRQVRRRGKPGVSKLVTVLASREGEPIPESELERPLLDAAAVAGVIAVRQFPLPWAREPIEGLVDAAVPASRLILEADGRSWHARLQAMAKDRRRDVEAARAGWLTLRFVHEDLRHIPSVAQAIADVHRSRVAA